MDIVFSIWTFAKQNNATSQIANSNKLKLFGVECENRNMGHVVFIVAYTKEESLQLVHERFPKQNWAHSTFEIVSYPNSSVGLPHPRYKHGEIMYDREWYEDW